MASILKRGSTWFVRVRRKGLPVQCGSFDRKVDAEAWARQVENEIDRGVFVSQREAESTTLHEALGRYMNDFAPRLTGGRQKRAPAWPGASAADPRSQIPGLHPQQRYCRFHPGAGGRRGCRQHHPA